MNIISKHILLTAPLWCGQLMAQEKPNIVFILTDDLGWTDLGCYGNTFNETPNIDALSHSGIRFTSAYSASPVSSPSRAAFLTGKHPATLQLTNFIGGNKTDEKSSVLPAKWKPYLESSETTIAEILKSNGYATGMVGKWHLGSSNECSPWNQGFEFTRMIGKNSLDYYNYSIFEDSYNNQVFDDSTYLTDKLTDYGIQFIKANQNKPFFLYMAYTAPHVFLVPKAGTESKYMKKYEHDKSNPYYAAMLQSLDEGIGRLLQQLKSDGILNNTIIVFTSDNGGVVVDELGYTPTNLSPLKDGKGSLYEGGIRIPAIISWKNKIQANQTSDFYFSNVDYFNTLLHAANIDYTNMPTDSKNQLSALTGETKTNLNDTLFWHYPHFSNQGGRPASAIRIGNYKLIYKYEGPKIELYNLQNDIGETKNISKKEIKKTKELLQALKKMESITQAELPAINKNQKK